MDERFEKKTQAEKYKEAGNQLAGEKDFCGALEQYDLAIQCDPTFAAAWLNKGIMHKKLNDYDKALSAFKEVLKIDANYHKAKWNLANVLEVQKKYLEAWRYYFELLRSHFSLDARLSCERCKQRIGAKIIFANVDLKLTKENKIKILEFGNGMQSGFIGYYMLTQQSVDELLEKELKKFALPVFINSQTGVQYTDPITDTKLAALAIPVRQNFSPEKFSYYHAIYGGHELIQTGANILKLNDAICNTVFEDKILTHHCFEKAGQLEYRPQTCILPKQYQAGLQQKIIKAFPNTTRFVLKVPDLEGGRGVVVVEKNDLDAYLHFLLSPNTQEAMFQASYDFTSYLTKKVNLSFDELQRYMQSLSMWKNSSHPEFMVEAYERSKDVMKDNKQYDGTIRVGFILTRDNGQYQIIPLAAYWKLPASPINQGTLRDCCVSSYSDTHKASLLLSKQDQETVLTQLNEILPKVFDSMIGFNIAQHIEQLPEITYQEKEFKANACFHLANTYVMHGEPEIADQYLASAKKLTPQSQKYYHQLGIHNYAHKKYDAAIESFNQAIKMNPQNSASYFRRGHAWLAKGNVYRAKQDFDQASQYNPSYKNITEYILQKYEEHSKGASSKGCR